MEDKKYNEELIFITLKKQGLADDAIFAFIVSFNQFLQQYFTLEIANSLTQEELDVNQTLNPEEAWENVVEIVRERSEDKIDLEEFRNNFWKSIYDFFQKSNEVMKKVMDKIKNLSKEEIEVEIREITTEVLESMGFEDVYNKKNPEKT